MCPVIRNCPRRKQKKLKVAQGFNFCLDLGDLCFYTYEVRGYRRGNAFHGKEVKNEKNFFKDRISGNVRARPGSGLGLRAS